MEVIIDGYKVSEENCNGLLTNLYKRRDEISMKIDRAISVDDILLEDKLNSQYDNICDTIDKLCEYRKNHNCLLEGDPGFRFY